MFLLILAIITLVVIVGGGLTLLCIGAYNGSNEAAGFLFVVLTFSCLFAVVWAAHYLYCYFNP